MPQSFHPTSNDPASNMQTGARVAFAGMIVNVFLAAAKITAGLLGNSYVLIADGIESVLDIGGSAVIWGGLKFASRPPDATHPYGHGKAEPLAAGIVALGVLAAALGLAIQSMREIFLPHHAPAPFTLIVLVVVVAVKEFLYRSVIHLGKNVESTAVQTDAWHHRADAMTSIAAFIGISIALIGGERWQSADAWAALFACAIIAMNGYRLLFPALHEMLDTAPRGEIVAIIKSAAISVPGVLDVEKCLVRKMGLSFYVDLHVGVDGGISVREGHHIAHQVKDAIKRTDSRIADVLVHIEPART
jgi:cation diffusion facilitator family transporter